MSRLVCVADYQQYAEENLPKAVCEYFNSGANYEQTYADNIEAFKRYKFRPRYMSGKCERQMNSTLLGQEVSCPFGVSPMALCRLAHPDGEVALARACESEGLCFALSMTATSSMEEIGQAAPGCTRWLQAHVMRDRGMMQRMFARAERAGFSAIVLTVDCVVYGKRYKDLRNHFSVPSHLKIANFESELNSVFISENSRSDWNHFVKQVFSPVQTWQDIRWLKTVSSLPIVAKGIITASDAVEAVNHGAEAIWVSNHGGRDLDGLPATIDALGEVHRAVGDRAEVYLDGGIRSGLDVLKALARGARAVFCGRPALWGLVNDGEQGAINVLNILKEELHVGMTLTGVTDVKHIPNDIVVHEAYYSKL